MNEITKRHFEPAVKWSGSKRSQVWEILKYFPTAIDTYYEPFCGGCSVLMGLLLSQDVIKVKRFVCSDLNSDLINLWNAIKKRPNEVSDYYRKLWGEMNSTDDRGKKRSYFEGVRARLNKEHNPLDFLFILRTTTNGMPRYNADGQFNNSFHITRDGIRPDKLDKIIHEWSAVLNKYNTQFITQDYREVLNTIGKNDFIYLDPPYANIKSGMYFGTLPTDELFYFLRQLPCHYLMSYDGKAGAEDNTYDVPEDCYTDHIYIDSGNSSFRRVIGNNRHVNVQESLYIK